jgi:ArsR family transcriptional regulator
MLGHPTRLSILATLLRSPAPAWICDFAAPYEFSQPTISHHMAKLKAAGLVESHKDGIWV